MNNNLQTISWDNSNVYKDFADPQIAIDLLIIEKNINYIKSKITLFENLVPVIQTQSPQQLQENIPLARELSRLEMDSKILLFTLGTFGRTANSVNSLNYDAKNLCGKVTQLMTNLNKAAKPLQIFLMRAPQPYIDYFLNDESVKEMAFSLHHARKEEDFLLNISEEVLLEGHAVDGLKAWGKLYSDMTGAMKVSVDGEEMGLAQAANILFQGDRPKREVAYRSINKTWEQYEISAGAILNSINGWRLENNRARSHKRELHYLDKSCHNEKISRATLEALMQTTYEERDIGQEALRLMAKEIGVKKLAPWDILAPFPNNTPDRNVSFPEAIEIVSDAFAQFSPEMAQFSRMMAEKKWIDSAPSDNRASGAHCTGFARTREPRVFITYDGSMKNIITLAHEIGHAYHSWVMRDLKFGETSYSSSLAETASIFAETLVRDALLEKATTKEEKKKILWQEIESAATLLINIPARFDFECRLLELRKEKSLNVPDLKKLNNEAWNFWYEDTLSEYNDLFWAGKLHFAMAEKSFYNYPYLFGYLFSLGIYAKKKEYGDKFKKLYVEILRDTGAMTAEELIKKHFNEDISSKDFWKKSLQIVRKSVDEYKKLI